MSNLIIYTDNSNSDIMDVCKKCTDMNIAVKSADEIKNMAGEDADIVVLDINIENLKDLSMVMKFTIPAIVITDKIPIGLSIRGETFDFIVKPVEEYELSLRIKNLLKIKELKENIENVTTTDNLTGLHNRKYMLERLESEMSRARRYKSKLSCILFDLDFFKVVNDMYGYEWGDVLLKKIAEMLLNLARKEDIVTRYGDEEFMVILPDTSEENAFIFAERFRRDVEKMQFIPAGEDERHPVKISGGIASYPCLDGNEEDANALIRYAEHALYNAKKRGKNRVILFSQVNLDF